MKHPTKLRYLAPETEAIVIQTNQRLCQGSPMNVLLLDELLQEVNDRDDYGVVSTNPFE